MSRLLERPEDIKPWLGLGVSWLWSEGPVRERKMVIGDSEYYALQVNGPLEN